MPVSEWLIVHMALSVGFRWKGFHKIFEAGAVFRGQISFQGVRQGAFQTAHPALAFVVQVGAPASHFTARIHLHPVCGADNPHHLPFWQDFAAAHTGALWHVLYALNRLLRRHLQITRRPLSPKSRKGCLFPGISRFVAALVNLTPDHFAQVFIELKFDGFLFALLTLLLVGGILFGCAGGLEDFWLHLE